MRRTKQNYRKYFEENVKIENQVDQVKSNLNLVKSKPTRVLFNRPVLISSFIFVLFLSLTFFYFSTKPNQTANSIPTARITIDVNPSIELVVDQNNLVLSVSGLNDDGKVVIFNEEIKGLDLTKAIEKIIELETKLGYLVTTNVLHEDNTFTISIGTDDERIKEELKAQITQTINTVCSKLKVRENIEFVKEKSKAELIKLVLKFNPTLTEEEANSLSFQELLQVIIDARIETVKLVTVELEELYFQLKAYEIKLIENEYIKKFINNLDSSYQVLINGYDEVYSAFKEAIIKLETAITKESDDDSDFQKVLIAFNSIAEQIENLLTLINDTPLDGAKEILITALNALKDELESKKEELIQLKEIIVEAINKAIADVDEVLTNIEDLKASFPSEIKTILNDHLGEIETQINLEKNLFFEKFEEKYREIIERAISDLLDKKA